MTRLETNTLVRHPAACRRQGHLWEWHSSSTADGPEGGPAIRWICARCWQLTDWLERKPAP